MNPGDCSPHHATLCLDLTDARVDLLEFDAAVASGEPVRLNRLLPFTGAIAGRCVEECSCRAIGP